MYINKFPKTAYQNNKVFPITNSNKNIQQFHTTTQTSLNSLSKSSQSLSIKSFQQKRKKSKDSSLNNSKKNTKPSPIRKLKHIKLKNSRNASCKENNSVKLSDLISLVKQRNFTNKSKNRCSEPSISSVSDLTQPKSSADTSATSKRIHEHGQKFNFNNLSMKSLSSAKNKNNKTKNSMHNTTNKYSFISKKDSIEISSVISEESVFSSKTNSYNKKQSSQKKNRSNNYNYTIGNTIDSIKKKLWKNIEEKQKKDNKKNPYHNFKCPKQKEEFLDISLTYSDDSLTRRIKEREENKNAKQNYHRKAKEDNDFKLFCEMMNTRLFGSE